MPKKRIREFFKEDVDRGRYIIEYIASKSVTKQFIDSLPVPMRVEVLREALTQMQQNIEQTRNELDGMDW